MENITAEQFLEQPKEVQKIFLDWFENNADSYDLVCTDTKIKYISFYGDLEFGEKADYFPLLTEGQLRKFIEDKTGCYIDISHNSMDTCIQLCDKEDEYPIEEWEWQYLSNDLLQAYWKVAVEIASKEVKEQ